MSEAYFSSLNSSHPYFSAQFASGLDSSDSLSYFRSEFHIPSQSALKNKTHSAESTQYLTDAKSNESIYLCGNSLGLQPRRTAELIQGELNKWANLGVEGHFYGVNPWATIDSKVTEYSEEIVGAESGSNEVAVCNSLSVNLHLLLISFYRPTASKYKILIEESAFCSDHHVVRSQLQLHGYTAEQALIQLKPRVNEYALRTEDVITTINQHKNELCCILLPGVQFYTGQLFDIESITAAGHSVGCSVGWDLAHAAGNAELELHEWKVDFAAWCSYKYLNSGPGSIAGLFVHSCHHERLNELTRLSGWWGQHPSIRFQMLSEHQPAKGAQAYLMSNPAVLPTICLQASLELFHKAKLSQLRQKSIRLTAYAELCVREVQKQLDGKSKVGLKIITPSDPKQRGCQLSLLFDCTAKPILQLLEEQGCITDLRAPNVIRVSPAPLYNSFSDVYKFAQILLQVLSTYAPNL